MSRKKIQNEDVKDLATLVSLGADQTNLIHDTKIYSAQFDKPLADAIADGDIVASAGGVAIVRDEQIGITGTTITFARQYKFGDDGVMFYRNGVLMDAVDVFSGAATNNAEEYKEVNNSTASTQIILNPLTPAVAQEKFEMVYVRTDGTSGGGSGGGSSFDGEQVAHGFSLLDAIRHNGAGWVKAQATTINNSAQYIVTALDGPDNFTASKFGRFPVIAHGKTVGSYYYLSSATAGGSVLTEPNISCPLFYVEDANTVHIRVHRTIDKRFIGLTDTPSTLFGEGGKYLAVNAGGTAIELVGGGGGSFLALSDVPNSYSGQTGKMAIVNGAEDALVFVDAPDGNTARRGSILWVDRLAAGSSNLGTVDNPFTNMSDAITQANSIGEVQDYPVTIFVNPARTVSGSDHYTGGAITCRSLRIIGLGKRYGYDVGNARGDDAYGGVKITGLSGTGLHYLYLEGLDFSLGDNGSDGANSTGASFAGYGGISEIVFKDCYFGMGQFNGVGHNGGTINVASSFTWNTVDNCRFELMRDRTLCPFAILSFSGTKDFTSYNPSSPAKIIIKNSQFTDEGTSTAITSRFLNILGTFTTGEGQGEIHFKNNIVRIGDSPSVSVFSTSFEETSRVYVNHNTIINRSSSAPYFSWSNSAGSNILPEEVVMTHNYIEWRGPLHDGAISLYRGQNSFKFGTSVSYLNVSSLRTNGSD